MTTESATDDQVVARRRRVVVVAICVVLVLVLAVIIGSMFRATDPEPSPGEGLLPWPPRGALATDQTLIDMAESLWRAGTDVEGNPVVIPGDEIYVLWADQIGAGRLVVLEAIGTDGNPYVAQASEQGDPAVLRLDRVEAIPSADLVALAVTYDGNLHIDGLEPGRDSALIQLLPEPPESSVVTGLWRYNALADSSTLERLETKPSGMTETFLQVDASNPAGTPVVVAATVGASAGVAGTMTIRGGELVPQDATVALVDDPEWGPSGRIDGSEYTALTLAVTDAGVAEARGFVAASDEIDVDGTTVLTSLVVLRAEDRPSWIACVISDPGPDDTIEDVVVTDPRSVVVGDHRVLAGSCPLFVAGETRVVAAAAARAGAGQVVLESDGLVVAGPAESLIAVLDEQAARGTVVASIDGGEGPGSSYSLSPWLAR